MSIYYSKILWKGLNTYHRLFVVAIILCSLSYYLYYMIDFGSKNLLDGLPAHIQTEDLEIWRTSAAVDYSMCLRAKINKVEAQEFVDFKYGSNKEKIQTVDYLYSNCDAPFWPEHFLTLPLAYNVSQDLGIGGMPNSASGAFYENGYLYYWSYSF